MQSFLKRSLLLTWDSADVSLVVDSLVYLATADSLFGRHKYQTSDYGYWGNIVNLRFTEHTDTFYTEIQVKTYPMIYAADVPEIVRETIGDEYYQYIHDITGVEPGLSHVYYEIIRADDLVIDMREPGLDAGDVVYILVILVSYRFAHYLGYVCRIDHGVGLHLYLGVERVGVLRETEIDDVAPIAVVGGLVFMPSEKGVRGSQINQRIDNERDVSTIPSKQ